MMINGPLTYHSSKQNRKWQVCGHSISFSSRLGPVRKQEGNRNLKQGSIQQLPKLMMLKALHLELDYDIFPFHNEIFQGKCA